MSHASFESTYPIYAVAWSSAKPIILGGGGGASKTGIPNAITVCTVEEVEEKKSISQLYTHSTGTGAVTSVDMHPTAEEMVCLVADDLEAYTFSTEEKKIEPLPAASGSLPRGIGPQRAARFNSTGDLVATVGDEDNILRVWTYPDFKSKGELGSHTNSVYDFCFSPDSKMLASASADKTCAIWDVDGCKCLKVLRSPVKPETAQFRGCRFSPDGKFLYTAQNPKGAAAVLTMWDTSDWSEVQTLHTLKTPTTAFTSSGSLIATGTADGTVAVFQCSPKLSRKCVFPEVHELPVTALVFSPDSSHLLTVSLDKFCRYIELKSPKSSGVSLSTLLPIILVLLAILLAYLNILPLSSLKLR